MSRLALVVLLALTVGGATASGADFTASSHSPTTISAAADFNTVAVTLADPPALVGTVSLSATASSNRGIASVRFQLAPSGTSDWTDVCTVNAGPYACSWNSASVPDGTYLVRAHATDGAGYTKTTGSVTRTVDNHAMTVTLTDPGAMGGTEDLKVTAANPQGAFAELSVEHRAAGTTTWTSLPCNGTISPATCPLDTTALPEDDRELRAIARDTAGNVVRSTPITRLVDNTEPTVTATVPPTATGNVTVSAEASDSGSGIKQVDFQAKYQGSWYTICTDAQAPYECTADSAIAADGTYQVRVVTTDNAGVQTISPESSIVVDNPPRGVSIAAGNAGTPGQLGTGDWVQLTWTEQIAPASVLAGWTGTSQAIKVRVTDAVGNDQMDFLTTGGARLDLVLGPADLKLGANFVTATSEFNATMLQTGSSIRVTLGAQTSGTLATAAAGTLTWRPSSAATDLSGKASRTDQVSEAGGLDVDF